MKTKSDWMQLSTEEKIGHYAWLRNAQLPKPQWMLDDLIASMKAPPYNYGDNAEKELIKRFLIIDMEIACNIIYGSDFAYLNGNQQKRMRQSMRPSLKGDN